VFNPSVKKSLVTSNLSAHCLSLLFLLSVAGCSLTDHDDEEYFESPIIIELKQELHPEQQRFFLQCRTEKMYSATPYKILNNWTREGREITLQFTGIERPWIAGCMFDYARARIDFGLLPYGVYNLSIYIKEVLVPATLTVTEEYWKINGGNSKWTILPRSHLWRVPANVVWGLIGYNRESSLQVILSYYDSLEALGAGIVLLPCGDYGVYTIDQYGVIGSPHQDPGSVIGGHRFNVWYIRSYIGPSEPLRYLIKYIGESHGDSISVDIHFPDGHYYASAAAQRLPWLLAQLSSLQKIYSSF